MLNVDQQTHRRFAPQWVLELPSSATTPPVTNTVRGGRSNPFEVLVADVPVRSKIRIGYCSIGVIPHSLFGSTRMDAITCSGSNSTKPPQPPARLYVAAFPLNPYLRYRHSHQILDAAPSLGLAAPLIQSMGYDVRWLHTGLFGVIESQRSLAPLRSSSHLLRTLPH